MVCLRNLLRNLLPLGGAGVVGSSTGSNIVSDNTKLKKVELESVDYDHFVQKSKAEDEVFFLPGWNDANGNPKRLLSKTYAGYVDVTLPTDDRKMFEHYLYFEAEGMDPSSAPLLMWTNGGPGASSFFGAFSELGPYYLSYDSITDNNVGVKSSDDKMSEKMIPTLFENHYRWTKLGNLLIRNLPPPIGYSYCSTEGPSGNGYSCGTWNDTSVALHSAKFMKSFVTQKMPNLKGRDTYLIGESYAGVYIPTLARELVKSTVFAPQLKGIAIGDGCITGLGCFPLKGPKFIVDFYYGHSQFSTVTYKKIYEVCSEEELINGINPSNTNCKNALNQMDKEKGYSFDYNLYDECYDFSLRSHSNMMKSIDRLRPWYENPFQVQGYTYEVQESEKATVEGQHTMAQQTKMLEAQHLNEESTRRLLEQDGSATHVFSSILKSFQMFQKRDQTPGDQKEEDQTENDQEHSVSDQENTSATDDTSASGGMSSLASNKGSYWSMDGHPCGGTAVLNKWVAHSEVKNALNVAPNATFFTGDNGVGFKYIGTEPNLMAWYNSFLSEVNPETNSDFRILIYNGDTDPGLNVPFSEYWTSKLNLQKIESWRPWTRDGRKKMGGFVTRYKSHNKTNQSITLNERKFDYLTIRGSGHMVPEYKPEAAFVLLKSFINNIPYPKLNLEHRILEKEPIKAVEPDKENENLIFS